MFYAELHKELTDAVDATVLEAKQMVKNGIPPDMLVPNLIEHFGSLAVGTEQMMCGKYDYKEEEVAKMVEDNANDEKLNASLQAIQNLPSKYEELTKMDVPIVV